MKVLNLIIELIILVSTIEIKEYIDKDLFNREIKYILKAIINNIGSIVWGIIFVS